MSRPLIAPPPGFNCATCHQPTRPRGTPLKDHPGTVLYGAHGECKRCRIQTVAEASDPTRILHSTWALNDYIAARRNRLGEAA